MGNEASKVDASASNIDMGTKFNTLPRGKKMSIFGYKNDTLSKQSSKKPANIDSLESGIKALQICKAENVLSCRKYNNTQDDENFRLKRELVAKELQISKLKDLLKDKEPKNENAIVKETRAKLENMTKKYLDTKLKYFVTKEEKDSLEDQIEAQKHELDGIQAAYIAIKRSQERRATIENEMITKLLFENAMIKQQLRSQNVIANKRKNEYRSLKMSFTIVKDAFDTMIRKHEDVFRHKAIEDTPDKEIGYKMSRIQRKHTKRSNKCLNRSKISDSSENKCKGEETQITFKQTGQVKLEVENKTIKTRRFELNGIHARFNLTRFYGNTFRITVGSQTSLFKIVQKSTEKLQLLNRIVKINQWIAKDYIALRMQVNILRCKLVRNKKLLRRFNQRQILENTRKKYGKEKEEFTQVIDDNANVSKQSGDASSKIDDINRESTRNETKSVLQHSSVVLETGIFGLHFSENPEIKEEKTLYDTDLTSEFPIVTSDFPSKNCRSEYDENINKSLQRIKLKFECLTRLFDEAKLFYEEFSAKERNFYVTLHEKENEISELKSAYSMLKSQLDNAIETRINENVVQENMKLKLENFTEAMNSETPKGWSKRWASWSGQFYYVNTFTNQAQMERPS